MFVSTKRFRRNPEILFIDKRLPMGSIAERSALSFLERLVSPTGNLAYKIFNYDQKEKFCSWCE